MSTDDAGTAKDAEKTEAIDDAAKPGDSAAEAAKTEPTPSLTKEPAKAGRESAPASTGGSGGKSATLPIVAAFVAGILLVAAITAVVVFYLQADKRGEELSAVDDSTHAACVFGRNVSTYDFSNNLQGYFDTVKAGATGDFLKEFGDAQGALSDAMVKAQVKSWVDDAQCGYQSGDTEQAKVLVTLTQYRTNFTQGNPERQYVVVVADMRNEDGRWKVAKLDSPMLKGAGNGLPGGAAVPGGQGQTQPSAPAPAPGN